MEIYNKNLLDANCYDQIIMRTKSCKQIDVNGKDEKYPIVEVGEPFSNTLNGLDDYETILKVAERFLNCTKLTNFSWLSFLPKYDQYFATVRGYDRMLAFQAENNPKVEDLMSLIWNKYDMDRREFLENQSDIKLYKINQGNYESFYRRNDYFKMGSDVEISLSRFDFDDMEQNLLKDFINDKIKSSDSEVCINQEEFYRWPEDGFLTCVNTIRVDDTVIELSNSIVPDVQNILDEFNNNLKRQKNMQLKLEGF